MSSFTWRPSISTRSREGGPSRSRDPSRRALNCRCLCRLDSVRPFFVLVFGTVHKVRSSEISLQSRPATSPPPLPGEDEQAQDDPVGAFRSRRSLPDLGQLVIGQGAVPFIRGEGPDAGERVVLQLPALDGPSVAGAAVGRDATGRRVRHVVKQLDDVRALERVGRFASPRFKRPLKRPGGLLTVVFAEIYQLKACPVLDEHADCELRAALRRAGRGFGRFPVGHGVSALCYLAHDDARRFPGSRERDGVSPTEGYSLAASP